MKKASIAFALSSVVIAFSAAARAEPSAAFAPLTEVQGERVASPPLPPQPPARTAPSPTRVTTDRESTSWSWTAPDAPRAETVPADRGAESAGSSKRDTSDDWMLALAAVTHAPLDAGVELGVETPFGLRVSGGYGWVPGAYLGLVTRAAGSASGADPLVSSLITQGFQSGHSWRVQGGIRPFRSLGLYLDAGYARVALAGSLDASQVGGLSALGVHGGYSIDATLDMWVVELGYQAHLGDHVVLAAGVGMMGTFAAHTTASRLPGSARIPALDASTTSAVDRALEQHGFLPTLTLRLGADLI